MKCAMDLCATAAVIAAENAAAEAARLQKEKQEKHDRTIAFCERIGAELERLAESGKKPEYSFSTSRDGWELKDTYDDYCDKRLSYNPVGGSMDISVFADWFKPYCFKVTQVDFKYYWHGRGLNFGYRFVVTPDPDCFKK